MKMDNHLNAKGFKHERDEFFDWLIENGLNNNFFLVVGDNHWSYHAISPEGVEEFSCGSAVQANSIVGCFPGDPRSTDPEGLITHLFQLDRPVASFVDVTLKPADATGAASLTFTIRDQSGKALYTAKKSAQ